MTDQPNAKTHATTPKVSRLQDPNDSLQVLKVEKHAANWSNKIEKTRLQDETCSGTNRGVVNLLCTAVKSRST